MPLGTDAVGKLPLMQTIYLCNYIFLRTYTLIAVWHLLKETTGCSRQASEARREARVQHLHNISL